MSFVEYSSHSNKRELIDSTPPRIVTPTKSEVPRKINVGYNDQPGSPLLHQPTVSSGGLTYASPFKPTEPVRYSLTKGKEAVLPPFSPTSTKRRTSAESNNKLQAAHSLALRGGSKIRKQDPNAYKIFLLLLQPQSKIFELIQLIYSPNDTTVGQILELIPENATEPSLGSQEYIGLCRPKNHEEILDKNKLASEARPGIDSARITLGEILVAIPRGFSGPDVAQLSKQILANPKIVKLLKRADPLAPKNKRRHTSSRRNKSPKVRAAEQVHVLHPHDEAEEEPEQKQEAERLMRMAMEHAVAEAAAANAEIPGNLHSRLQGAMMQRSESILSETRSIEDFSAQESLDESFSSWSKSFDASFSAQSSICSGVSKRAARRKDRQARRIRILQQSAGAAFGLMILFYVMDPNKNDEQVQLAHEAQTQMPMGLMGIFQCLFLLLTLYKIERLVRTTVAANHYQKKHPGEVPAVYMSEERRCPFLKASARALKRFKSRYAKRFKKSGGAPIEEEQLSHKLRSFSLKATDTGSL